jgi:hypothetical protein
MTTEQQVIKELRGALVKATELCMSHGIPSQNRAQFLSLVNGAIDGANEEIGENSVIENTRSRWSK